MRKLTPTELNSIVLDLLKSAVLLQDTSLRDDPAFLKRLGHCLRHDSYPSGAVLCSARETGSCMYFLLRGSVLVMTLDVSFSC